MSAWHVLSVLGFYPVCLGSGEYVLGISNVRNITVRLLFLRRSYTLGKPHKGEILGTGEQDIPNFIFNDSLI